VQAVKRTAKMPPYNPRAQLSTHEVSNQPSPLVDINLYDADLLLTEAAGWSGAGAYSARLSAFGAEIGSEAVQDEGRLANAHGPVFKPFDRFGRRIDEVEFHPAYHTLMARGLEAGVSSAAWTEQSGGHALHVALLILMGMTDGGVCCPMSMTYAAMPTLQVEPAMAAVWGPRITAARYDARMLPPGRKSAATIGMAMTEKQGGSDVRANTSRAVRQADGAYRLTGHKWFCSAPMSDAFLTLAYAEGGLTCFLVPRWRPDGERNGIEIQRLKDKLGDRSNASSEIEYRDAYAERLGEEGRGVRTILEMVSLTRLDCIAGSAGLMRHAVSLAAWHAQGRSVFQRRLSDQPLMRAVLADLSLDAEAGLALAFRLAQALDSAAPEEKALARIGLPLGKYLITKRAPVVAAEAMECLGGAGYVEESGMPRLFRASPLNAIWEGSGNVIALDVMRALSREPDCTAALQAALAAGRGFSAGLDDALQAADGLLAAPLAEADARSTAEHLALCLAAVTLAGRAPDFVTHGFVKTRMVNARLTYGAGAASLNSNRLMDRLALQA
jgi:putative acyl-CoA dehydrogenase